MSTNKHIPFAAKYRSSTFHGNNEGIIGRNGVMNGGEVTENAGVLTMQPMTVVQNGMLVDITHAVSAAVPNNLIAPYFVGLSFSTTIQNAGETITPIFVKRPQDITSSVILVAEYDGNEWRALPLLQIEERVKAVEAFSVNSGLTGVASGFAVTQDSTTLTVAPGTLVAADGSVVTKEASTAITKVADPVAASSTHNRIDNVVFRKAADSEHRIGAVKYVVGPTYAGDTGTVSEAPTSFATSAAPSKIKALRLMDGVYMMLVFKEGTDLKIRRFADTFSSSAVHTVATNVDNFDACQDFDGHIDFVYTRSGTLYKKRVSTVFAEIHAEAQIYTSVKTLHEVAVACVGKENDYELHIAACKELTGTAREIAYLRLASDSTLITPYTTWVNLTSQLKAPTFAKDDGDSMLWMGFEDADAGKAYLYQFDASTADASTPPEQVGSAIELQSEVYNTVTASAMSATGATDLRVVRTDNKEIFVFWKHFKGSGNYGVAIYNSRYTEMFAHKALIVDNAHITDFDVTVDDMNRAYITSIDAGGTNIKKDVFNLETLERIGTSDTIRDTNTFTELAVLFAPRGDLLHAFSDTTASLGRVMRSTAAVSTTLRDQYVCPTDVYLAHNRISDSLLKVSDFLVGEEISVRRLYEFANGFAGAAGTISWNVAGANKLVFNSAITLRFLNRKATYTIAANNPGGITVGANSVLSVTIPDIDANATLTPSVTNFGEGSLDRDGRRTFPLFWNIGGVLYSRFAPFRLSSDGETVEIGDQMSQEMLEWLGASDSTPDPDNHGYGSTNFIAQDDSLLAAIGKLDNALGGGGGIKILGGGTFENTAAGEALVAAQVSSLSNSGVGGTAQQLAQALIPNQSGTFLKAKLRLWINPAGSLGGDIVVDLRADDGLGEPGAILATSEPVAASTLTTTPTDITFDFTGGPAVTSGTKYHIALNPAAVTGFPSPMIRWSNGNPDVVGCEFSVSVDGGASWGFSGIAGIYEAYILSGTSELSFTEDMFLEMKGLDYADNTIPLSESPIVFTDTLQAAYVQPNFATGGSNLTVTVADLADVPKSAIIIARTEGDDIIVGSSSTRLQQGQSSVLYAQASDQTLAYIGAPNTAEDTPAFASNIRGATGDNLTERVDALTSATGDAQEDRSSYLRSDDPITWTGAELQFTADIVLDITNSKQGGTTRHRIEAASSPLTLAANETAWFLVDRTETSEVVTLNKSNTTPVPAQTEANKDVFVLGRRVDVSGAGYLHIPLHKQVLEPGQTVRLGASGSGGEGNEYLERMRETLSDSAYELLTPMVFSSVKETLTESGSTDAVYSLIKKAYVFGAAGDKLTTVQLLDPSFLEEGRDVGQVDVVAFWGPDAVDEAAIYKVSRDGGSEFQTIEMERIGDSDTFVGTIPFEEEAFDYGMVSNLSEGADSLVQLDNANKKALSQRFTLSNAWVSEVLTASVSKTGSPVGTLWFEICADTSGVPGAVMAATLPVMIDSLSAGANVIVTPFNGVLPAGNYHIVTRTSEYYKDSWSVTDYVELKTRDGGVMVDLLESDDVTWSTIASESMHVEIGGRSLDVRIEIESSDGDKELMALGLFYGLQSGINTAVDLSKLMEDNRLGSTNPQRDRSAPGEGILLRADNGKLVELSVRYVAGNYVIDLAEVL